MTKWERMASRLEYFKDKKITDLSTEEISEYLEIKAECTRIAESFSKLVAEPMIKGIKSFFKGLK